MVYKYIQIIVNHVYKPFLKIHNHHKMIGMLLLVEILLFNTRQNLKTKRRIIILSAFIELKPDYQYAYV